MGRWIKLHNQDYSQSCCSPHRPTARMDKSGRVRYVEHVTRVTNAHTGDMKLELSIDGRKIQTWIKKKK